MTLGEVGVLCVLILVIGILIGMCIGPPYHYPSGYSGKENMPADAKPPRESGVPVKPSQTINVIVKKGDNE